MGSGGPSKSPKGKSKDKYVSTLKEAAAKGRVAEYAQNDCAWHRVHCRDEHFQHATRIREAYPFDEDAVKDVKEAQRPVGSKFKYSSAAQGTKVRDAGPRTLNCDVCGVFIANRLESEPFYFCRNCKANGRKLEVCLRCHRQGKLGQAPRKAEEDPFETHEEKQRRAAPPRLSNTSAGSALPSGIWIGTIVEEKSKRLVNRELIFHDGGSITGSGASTDPGATISGKVLVGKMKISWVEVHPWGRSKVEGTFLWSRDGSCIIKADFSTTDESTGTLELTGPRA